jgi:Legionella pneumophila major outer membrane protein precursor
MKNIFLISIAMTGALFATEPPSLTHSYNPTVRGGANVWIGVDFLYWKPWERALVLTNKQSDVFVTDDFTEAPVIHPNFKWDPGYRVSTGYLFSSNLWDVGGSWTHYTSRISQHLSTHGSPLDGMFPIWSLSNDVIAGDYVFESDLR